MIYAAVLAGGSGSRMGNTDKPKQFLELGGRPVIAHTVEAFLSCEELDGVLVLTPALWVDYTRELLQKEFGHTAGLPDEVSGHTAGSSHENFDNTPGLSHEASGKSPRLAVLEGGATRNETLMNAVRYIEEAGGLDDETIIVTQDAVRPFVTKQMILDNIEAAKRTGACETAFPATDTIIESADGALVTNVPDRSRLWMTQTPQSFRARKLRELYTSLTEEEKAVLTDAARIFVMKGEPVEIVMGASDNIKITYPGDIEIAEAILKRRRG